MSLVRMVLVVCLRETNDPTLDFVRLSMFGYVRGCERRDLPRAFLLV